MMRKVEVVPYNPVWRGTFEEEATHVAAVLGDNVVAVHHIGSTAIPTIHAKPIIDMLVEVRDITKVDECSLVMHALGYESMGEFGMAGRRFFRKENDTGIRTHHVHTFAVDSAEVERHLAFRDYLRVHADDAQRYSKLKQDLAQQYQHDIEGYRDGKDAFIKDMQEKAVAWQRSQRKM